MSRRSCRAIPANLGRPRFVPMVGDSMLPTIRPNDMVAVQPGAAWNGDGLYVIEEMGVPVVVRATSDFRGGVHVSRENGRYSAWTLTRDGFAAVLLGTVFAVCRVVDQGVAERAGFVAPLVALLDGGEA